MWTRSGSEMEQRKWWVALGNSGWDRLQRHFCVSFMLGKLYATQTRKRPARLICSNMVSGEALFSAGIKKKKVWANLLCIHKLSSGVRSGGGKCPWLPRSNGFDNNSLCSIVSCDNAASHVTVLYRAYIRE